MNECHKQQRALTETTTCYGGGTSIAPSSATTTTTNNSREPPAVFPSPPITMPALQQPPSHTSSIAPSSPFSYNSFVKRENDGYNRRLRDNNEFAVVLSEMIFNNNLPFSFAESDYLTKYNNHIYEFIMRYQQLPQLPSRKVVSNSMKAHIFDMQQTKIRSVCYMFLFLYVFIFVCAVFRG